MIDTSKLINFSRLFQKRFWQFSRTAASEKKYVEMAKTQPVAVKGALKNTQNPSNPPYLFNLGKLDIVTRSEILCTFQSKSSSICHQLALPK
jgi:hypothetical protein